MLSQGRSSWLKAQQKPNTSEMSSSPITARHTKSAFLTPLHVYFAIRLLFCVLAHLRYGRRDNENEEEVQVGGGKSQESQHRNLTLP